ncbi:MAG: hypothetical protein EXS46_03555 [Candidatus Taylorbacteria bacterium]|nr:hypothetical protein [Candidatus Taylorbacteria bacterium]
MNLETVLRFSNRVLPFLIALCILAFLVGIVLAVVFAVKMVDQREKKDRNRNMWIMIGCVGGPIVAIFILLSLWGFLTVLSNTFPS